MIPKRIVAIGTSAFFGVGDEKHMGGYIGRLKMWHESQNPDNEVYNLGISREGAGETTTEMLKRIIPEASSRQPNLILLTTGINDIRRAGGKENLCITSMEDFEKNIHDMIVAARSVVQSVMFISAYPIKDKVSSKNDYFLYDDLKIYTDVARDVCKKENVPFFDVFSLWEKENYSELLGPDGVHANTTGYENVFGQLKTFLLTLYS